MRFSSAIILAGLLASCAQAPLQKNDQTVVSKPSFFMTKPQATAPITLVVDEDFAGKKLIAYRKNSELRLSGSATFGPQGLKELAKPLKKSKSLLYVVDLRQESHGLINDQPVTWDAEKNWGLAELNHDEAIRHERRLLGDLRIGEKLGKNEIKSIETEESLVRSAGHQYLRLTVLDFVRPSDREVEAFVEAVANLPDQAWVHIHCRDGGNRTTLFMLLYDMLLNAKSISFEDLVKRNVTLSKDPNLLEIGETQNWQYSLQKERVEFVHEFYNYAKAHPRGAGKLWTEWVQK